MIIVTSPRPSSQRPPKLRYHSRPERLAMVAPLLELKDRHGQIPPHEKRLAAHIHQVSVRTIERAIAEADMPEAEPRAYRPSRELLVRVAMLGGNVWRAVHELADEGAELPSYQTAHRAIHADVGLQLALSKGLPALERYWEFGVYEPERRNELCYGDAMHIPVRCIDRYGTVIDDLWLVSIFEAYSRACLAHVVTRGEPNAQGAVLAFHAAVLGRRFSRADLAGKLSDEDMDQIPLLQGDRPYLIGGVPDAHITDNGMIYQSGDYAAAVQRFLPAGRLFSDPYNSTQRGKHERWHRTLQQKWFAGAPGYNDGPKRSKLEGEVPYAWPSNGRLPRLEAVTDAVNWAIDEYNWKHVVSTTGQAPFVRFLSDRTPLREIQPINLWNEMAVIGEYTVEGRGMKIDGAYRAWPGRARFMDQSVEVRGFTGIPGRLFARPDGVNVIEIRRHADRSEEERLADGASNARRLNTFKSVLQESGERLEAEGLPAEDMPKAVAQEYKRSRRSNPPGLADPTAVLGELEGPGAAA